MIEATKTSKTRLFSVVAALAFGAACLYSPASAQFTNNSEEPILINSDQAETREDQDFVVLKGNVQVVQGTAILTAPQMTIYGIGDDNPDKMEATGGVRYTDGSDAISGDRAIYLSNDSTVTFIGNVVVVQEEQVLTGNRLVYNTETGKINITSKPPGRVRGMFITKRSSSQQ